MIAIYYHQPRNGKGSKMCIMKVDSDDFQHVLSKFDEDNPWPASEIVFIENDIEINRYHLEDGG